MKASGVVGRFLKNRRIEPPRRQGRREEGEDERDFFQGFSGLFLSASSLATLGVLAVQFPALIVEWTTTRESIMSLSEFRARESLRDTRSMKRPRITIRRLILLIALIAVGLGIYREFRDGFPPRFVVQGIPDRMAKLRVGMTRKDVYEIVGLDRPWFEGGILPCLDLKVGGARFMSENWYVGESNWGINKRAWIYLGFRNRVEVWEDEHAHALEPLKEFSYSISGRTIVEVPDLSK
jgi:hypothetical protein